MNRHTYGREHMPNHLCDLGRTVITALLASHTFHVLSEKNIKSFLNRNRRRHNNWH